MRLARHAGVKAGLLRLRTLWPFPEAPVRELAGISQRLLVVEMNRGQMLSQVQRIRPDAQGFGKTDGDVIAPEEIVRAMQEGRR